ncbi:1501_t:CDS:2 [Funneliformis geosporum]|nr:1501_t:CDS:2 [Funneliformis geosporum]
MSPRTDLCDTCQHFQNSLQYNARKEEEAKDLLKKYKEHLVKAKLERNYYNKNTKLAEQQRKLVDENYLVTGELEQRNKQLLEEINNINKKREEEIEDLKLKIWRITGQSLDDKGEVSMYAPRGT